MNELHRLILAALIVDGLAGCEIAFIDEAGQIIKSADMAPGNQTRLCASASALVALAFDHGLLTASGIRAGSSIDGLPRGI